MEGRQCIVNASDEEAIRMLTEVYNAYSFN